MCVAQGFVFVCGNVFDNIYLHLYICVNVDENIDEILNVQEI